MMPKVFKARWLWIVIAVCAIVLLGALMPLGDPGNNVQVALVGFTNQAGRKVALFCGTNSSKRSLTYDLDVKTNFPGRFYPKILLMVQRGGPIAPEHSFTFTMDAPAETADWEPVFLYRFGTTKREEVRTCLAELVYRVGMEDWAQEIVPPAAEGSIPLNSSEKPERWLTRLGIED